jgi:hypothetical protein
MRYLIEYAGQETVTRVIDQVMDYDIVHGVVVQLDPTWLALWRFSQSLTRNDWKGLDEELRHSIEWDEHLLGRPWSRSAGWGIRLPWTLGPAQGDHLTPIQVDPKWTCSTWKAITDRDARGRREPFIINVLVLPRSAKDTFEKLTSTLDESSERIRFEARPIPRAYVNRKGSVRPLEGGISLGTDAGDYATLGGILKDGKGVKYALTCGHAISKNDKAKQPSPKDDSSATRIGTCIESTSGSLHGPISRCNRKAAVNEVDAALIELDKDSKATAKLEVLAIGPLAGWAAIDDVYEDSPIEVSGRSGRRDLYTGGLLVIGGLLIGADRFCFRNLIQIKRASVRSWGLTGTLARPVRPGDSGAWVIQDGPNGPEWCGMIIGGTGPIGYAVFAETILDWLKGLKYNSLSVA